mmetsp:Transcript_72816/g.201889  ORF Transcript_72816/g.201889 Transcript_72816/m.201889 type:complete len:216 (+) Transcript_72816:299-946(+)
MSNLAVDLVSKVAVSLEVEVHLVELALHSLPVPIDLAELRSEMLELHGQLVANFSHSHQFRVLPLIICGDHFLVAEELLLLFSVLRNLDGKHALLLHGHLVVRLRFLILGIHLGEELLLETPHCFRAFIYLLLMSRHFQPELLAILDQGLQVLFILTVSRGPVRQALVVELFPENAAIWRSVGLGSAQTTIVDGVTAKRLGGSCTRHSRSRVHIR